MQTVDFEKFKLQKGDRILDLGCGEGRHAITAYMLQQLDAVAVDLSFDDLKITQTRFEEFRSDDTEKSLSIIQANGMVLPFADHTFDKIICSEVLLHIPDYTKRPCRNTTSTETQWGICCQCSTLFP